MNRKGFAPIVILFAIIVLFAGAVGYFLLFQESRVELKDSLSPESLTPTPTSTTPVASSTSLSSAGCRFAGNEKIYQNCLETSALSVAQFLDLLNNCQIENTVFAHVGFVFTTKDHKNYKLDEFVDYNSTVITKALVEARKTCGPIGGGIE